MRILPFLFLVFVGIPSLEIYLFIQVGAQIGALPTILLALAIMALGSFLIRHQGVLTLLRVRDSLQQGRAPAMALLEGVVMLLAGVLFLLPGFFTDLIALLLAIPPLRRALIRTWLRRSRVIHRPGGPGPTTFDGEFRREDQGRIEGQGPRNED
jgi:UPF0716 protein FxsA